MIVHCEAVEVVVGTLVVVWVEVVGALVDALVDVVVEVDVVVVVEAGADVELEEVLVQHLW